VIAVAPTIVPSPATVVAVVPAPVVTTPVAAVAAVAVPVIMPASVMSVAVMASAMTVVPVIVAIVTTAVAIAVVAVVAAVGLRRSGDERKPQHRRGDRGDHSHFHVVFAFLSVPEGKNEEGTNALRAGNDSRERSLRAGSPFFSPFATRAGICCRAP
jgi:hypothetical protein